MAQVDAALASLLSLFQKWGWEDWQQVCQKMIDDTDERTAMIWLYETLIYFEGFPDFDWTERSSGLLLLQAGLVGLSEYKQGAVALLIGEEVVV